MTRVFILSRYWLLELGVERLLSPLADIQVIGTDSDRVAAVECIGRLRPDVVVIEYDPSEFGSESVVARIRAASPRSKIVGVSIHDNWIYVYRRGAAGTYRVDDLVKAIRDVEVA